MSEIMDIIIDEKCEESPVGSSTDSPQEYVGECLRAKKRRKRSHTLKSKFKNMVSADISPSIETNCMTFNVVSSRDKNKHYIVEIKHVNNKFHFSCNCGDQFGVPTRDHCCHIGNPLLAMFNYYVSLHYPEEPFVEDMGMGELESMFKKFLQIRKR